MPKGVEHHQRHSLLRYKKGVKEPLMPKGVEHVNRMHYSFCSRRVKEPLMPKGVEHIMNLNDQHGWRRSERTFDAERR